MDKAEPYKFTTNVPVPCDIRFVDIRPGKLWTDPKGVTKKLPSQVSIKGKFGNLDTICFLPGPAWKNVKALAAGGVIAEEPALSAANDEELSANVSCAVLQSKVTLTLSKPAGGRYESLVVDNGKVSAPPEGRVPSPYQPPIIGRMPFDDEGAPPPSDADNPYADPGPLPPFHKAQPSRAAEVAPNAADRMKVAREYLDLLAWVQAETKLPPDVAQSASATIYIQWQKRGLS